MKRFKQILKIATTLSYFLPFTFFFISCDGLLGIQMSYNKKEALNMMLTEKGKSDSLIDARALSMEDTMVVVPADSSIVLEQQHLNTDKNKMEEYLNSIYSFAINPTDRSLSGFGILVFPMDDFSCTLISISILMSILILFDKLERIIKRNMILLYAIELSCLLLFIFFALFITHVDLEWGIYVTLVLTAIGLVLSVKDKLAAH